MEAANFTFVEQTVLLSCEKNWQRQQTMGF